MKVSFQPYLFYFVAGLLLQGCHTKKLTYTTSNQQYIFSDSLNNRIDTTSMSFISWYSDSLKKTMNTVLAISAQAMVKELPEGLLGNYCADACLHQVERICKQENYPTPDFLFLNHGGLRASLPRGKITIGNVYEVMPFENELVVLTMNGTDADSVLQHIASMGGAPVSGVRFSIDGKRAKDITVNGTALSATKVYHVATSDYLANGGDGFSVLKKFTERKILSLKVRDALLLDLKNSGMTGDSIIIQKDGRLVRIQ
jgi:2',3'-cyclic-nucleotide 2'-phosphodiesterase (5'-nucleotidase family)